MKKLLRRLSRNRVLAKRLPRDLGGQKIYCSPDALLSMWKPGWRSAQVQNIFRWARLLVRQGDVVWDLGANQGIFTFAASFRAGKDGFVIAFEPDCFLAWLLERSSSKQVEGSEVAVIPIAASGKNGLAAFSIASSDRALNHLAQYKGNPHTHGSRREMKVMCCTVDWLAGHIPRPDIIKIDVEGAEADVLQGASQTLSDIRPNVIVEVAPENEESIGEIFRSHNYRMLDAAGKGEEISRPAWNTLAVPVEKFEPVRIRFARG